MTSPDSLELAVAAARAADDKGATDILVVEVGPIVGIVGYFVVATASNTRLVGAVTDEVVVQLKAQYDVGPRSVEGADAKRWVLLDYADVVVHVFVEEERQYYRIERLYSDATKHEWRPEGHPELAHAADANG